MNHQNLIRFRAATPDFDEGVVFARYADEVTEGFLRFMLGRNVITILATAYMHPNHDYSYQNVIFAERDHVIVGMASGYTAKQRHHFSDQPLKQAAGYAALQMKAVKLLCAPLIRILDTIGEDDFYLLSIAVDKELRGEGVGSMLMDAVEDRARASGATRLSLDVSAKNEGARRLYEHRGMTVESQWPKRLVIPGFKLFRMTKTL
ncbi:GNAT family N-acetyltransferase [Anaerolineales bacterium HSG24]|nr:GNAT family N-acetyltransferase [Anaerolineales bacterium HSG24]